MAQNGDKVSFWRGSIKVFNKLKEDGRLTADRLYFVGNSQTDSEGLRDSTYGTIYLATSANWCVRFGIFSEDSDLDKIANEIYTAIEKEGVDRVKADNALQDMMTAEAAAREASDTALSQNISDEATARQTADTAIKSLLASDYATKTELQTAQTILQENISEEATARQEADASLQTSIESETTARKNADDLKADKAETYTKTETANLLDTKANKAETYTKGEVSDIIAEKADASDVYTKSEANDLLGAKADSSALLNYYTKSETYTRDEVDSLVEAKVAFKVVDALPAIGETAIIYLVPLEDPDMQNVYDEYMWIGGAWEHIGSTQTDLSGYYTKDETEARLGTKADSANVYSKTETDTKLNAKADSSSVYTRTETDGKLNGKADKTLLSLYYTKTEADSLLSDKQDTITGGASTIAANDLTASRVLVSDADGKVSVSHITSGELGYMQGVTSNLQKQISSKAENSEVAAKIGSLAYKLNDETAAREEAISDAKTELQTGIDTKADKAAVLDSFLGARTFPLLLKDGTDAPRWLFGVFSDYSVDPIGSLSVTHYPNTFGPTRLNVGGVQAGQIYLRGYGNNGWTSIMPSEGSVALTLPKTSGTLLTDANLYEYLKKWAQTDYVSVSTYSVDKSTIDGRLNNIEAFDTKATKAIDNLYTQVGGKEDALSEIATQDIDSLIDSVCV